MSSPSLRNASVLVLALFLAGCPDTDKQGGDDTGGDTGNDTGMPCTDLTADIFEDADGDGYGFGTGYDDCDTPPAHPVANADDCDDTNALVNPAAVETCNEVDDNCNGEIDEDLGTEWYADVDGDGFGDPASAATYCSEPADHVADSSDCDDTNANVNPEAIDLCSGMDENCDSVIDEPLTATWAGSDGTVVDVTTALAAGTSSDPAYIGDQAGYDLEVTDGTLYLCEGTWYNKIVLAKLGSTLNVVGVAGPDLTVMTTGGTTGGATGSIVAVTDTTLTLEGLTLTGGVGSEDGTKGGAIAVAQAGGTAATPNVTLRDVVLTGNRTAYGGAVALKDYASMSMVDSLIAGNEATAVGGGVWVQTFGTLRCEGTALAAAGVIGNTAPIAGGFYFSSKNDGTLDTTGCDWGDVGVDDNEPEDVDRQPHADNGWCFGNSAALTDTVFCDHNGCSGTNPQTCN